MNDGNLPNLEDKNQNSEEFVKSIATSFVNALPAIVAVGIAIWWVFYGTVEIIPTTLSITDQIGITICTIVLAVTYSGLIANGGFASAKKTVKWKKQSKEWSDAIRAGNKHKKEIELFAKDIAKENQYELRVSNLENNGLLYEDFFDENGNLYYLDFIKDKKSKKNPNGLTRKQINIIKKCINIRIIIPTLFGNLSSRFFGIKKEENQRNFELKTNIKNIIIRVAVSFVTVGVMFKFYGFSIEGILSSFFQIILWTSSGVSQRVANYNFVINKLLPQMVEKTLVITGYLSLDESKKREYEELAKTEKANRMKTKRITMMEDK
jgi:hypothetical protein